MISSNTLFRLPVDDSRRQAFFDHRLQPTPVGRGLGQVAADEIAQIFPGIGIAALGQPRLEPAPAAWRGMEKVKSVIARI